MTPKEKAEELVDKFYQTTPNESWINEPIGLSEEYTAWKQAKKCALIAVDEIINCDYFFKTLEDTKLFTDYWYKVQQEIKKL